MVRDGTYLVGTCGLVTKSRHVKIVYQSPHLQNSCKQAGLASSILTAGCAHESDCRRHRSRRSASPRTSSDTLGGRIKELVLPIPKDPAVRADIIAKVSAVVTHKNSARELTPKAILEVAPVGEVGDESEFLTMTK